MAVIQRRNMKSRRPERHHGTSGFGERKSSRKFFLEEDDTHL